MRLLIPLLVLALAPPSPGRLLYVAMPGQDAAVDDRDDEGVRVLVFDIDRAHRFVKRVSLWPRRPGEAIETVRGIAADGQARRLFISTVKRLAAVDLNTGSVVWQQTYEGHCCDRFSVSPDRRTIYAPAFGSPKWYVVSAATGELRATIPVAGWPRDTAFSGDGRSAYLAAWESPLLSIADTGAHRIVRTTGPFSASLCPFTVNAKGTLVFANVDGMVGFEVGDLQTGLILDRVAIDDVDRDEAAEYECPSHGIAFAPGQRELWVADGVRNRLHVFDAAVYPPARLAAVQLTAPPRWITFSADGHYAYASTGEIVDAAARRIAGTLEDDRGARVRSEKMVEIGASK